jgi:hypothetical protein
MRRTLNLILIGLVAFLLGMRFEQWQLRPIVLNSGEVVVFPTSEDEGEAGMVGSDGACELFWNTCWRKT